MREKLARSSGTPANTVEKRGGTLYGSSGSSLLRPPMLKTDPALPMQRMLPLLPMLRIEPALPMLKIEPVLPMRRIDPALPMLRTLKILPMLPTLSKLSRCRISPHVRRLLRRATTHAVAPNV